MLSALALVLLAQVHGDVTVSGRVDVRARSLVPADSSSTVPGAADTAAADLELTPSLSGSLTGSGVTARLAYTPTIRWRQPYSPARRSDTYHRQSFNLEWAREGRPKPYLAESFTYGLTDLTTLQTPVSGLPTGPVAPPTSGTGTSGTLPVAGVLQEMYIDGLFGVTWPLSRLVSLDTRVGFTYGGGADINSRSTLPLQKAPSATATLGVLVDPRNTLSTILNGQYSIFDQNGFDSGTTEIPAEHTEVLLVQVSERWEHQLTPLTRVNAALGGGIGHISRDVAATRTMMEQRTAAYLPLFITTAGITTRAGNSVQTFDFGLQGGAQPFIDRYAATLYERVELTPSLQWTYRQRLSARASLGAAAPVGTPDLAGVVYFYGDAAVSYEGQRYWLVSIMGSLYQTADLRGASSTPQTPVYTGLQWVLGLGLTIRNQETF